MNKKIAIFSSFLLILLTIIGIKSYTVIAKTQLSQSIRASFQTAIQNRSIILSEGGEIRVFNTKVIAIDGNNITTESLIKEQPITIRIHINDQTKLLKNGSSTNSIHDISTDKYLTVAGTLDTFFPNLTITAGEVRILNQPIYQSTNNVQRKIPEPKKETTPAPVAIEEIVIPTPTVEPVVEVYTTAVIEAPVTEVVPETPVTPPADVITPETPEPSPETLI